MSIIPTTLSLQKPHQSSSLSSSFINNGFITKSFVSMKTGNQIKRSDGSIKCMFGLGVPEIAVIVGVATLLFGPKKLPEIGRGFGQTINGFQQAAKEFESELRRAAEIPVQPIAEELAVLGDEKKEAVKVSSTFESNYKMGIEKQLLKAGKGPKPVKGQNVTVHCTGYGKDRDLSKKFWSTRDPGQQPFTFNIGHGSVIKGWDEGVMDMQLGEVARLQCSPDYAYGANGFPVWGIQPNSVLVFEIEVLSCK